METPRKAYGSDVSDAEWTFLVPYLSLMREDAPQREHPLRELFNGLRYVIKTGCPWRFLPHDPPPRAAVYPQARRWVPAGAVAQNAPRVRAIGPRSTQRLAHPPARGSAAPPP